MSEVLITDTNVDLNVYLETDADGTMKAASGQCCGIATKDETAASCRGGQAVCCADKDAERTAGDGGCGGCGEKLLDDLNEWAGEFFPASPKNRPSKSPFCLGSYKIFAVKI